MKLLALLVCLVICVWSSEAHVYESCPSGWVKLGTSCYRYFGQGTNQITAENICRQFSGCSGGVGHLVSMNTRKENSFFFDYVNTLMGTNIPPRFWLGGRRLPGTSRWMWSDGTEINSLTFNNFPGQSNPQEQGMNCMTYTETAQAEWMHINCERPILPFMCELKGNVPDPVTCPPTNPTGSNPPTSPLQAHPLPIRYNKAGNIEQRYTGRP